MKEARAYYCRMGKDERRKCASEMGKQDED